MLKLISDLRKLAGNELFTRVLLHLHGVDLAGAIYGRNLREILKVGIRLMRTGRRGVDLGYLVTIKHPFRAIGLGRVAIGNGCYINNGVELQSIPLVKEDNGKTLLTLGSGVYIGRYSQICACSNVMVGDYALISDNVFISDAYHLYKDARLPIMLQGLSHKAPVSIGPGTWIGRGAVILPGVTLGANCVVGANAVVTRSFPDGSVVGGVPAKLLSATASSREVSTDV